jgi:hypothetical protein
MIPRELPTRPNLEQLKKQAKSLLHTAQARDGDALRRFAALPTFSGKSIHEIDADDLALHDAQSVIAREYGLPGRPCAKKWRLVPCRWARPSTNSSAAQRVTRPVVPNVCSHSFQISRRRICTLRWFSVMPTRSTRDYAITPRWRRNPGDRRTGSRCYTHAIPVCMSPCRHASMASSPSRSNYAHLGRIRMRSITGIGTRSCQGPHCGARSVP